MILEDVATTWGSLVYCADFIRAAGYDVDIGLALVDREEGDIEKLRKNGIKPYSVVKKSCLIK